MCKHPFFRSVFCLLLVCLFNSCAPSKIALPEVKGEIAQIMDAQSQAWNRGDLEAFMEPYWHSDSLVFVGHSGPTFGWDKTLQNYKRSYPTQEAMGKLAFTLLHTSAISKDALLVVGKWHLSRRIGDLQGHFSLVFRKIGGKWQIVADHSS
ncbi:hypothetical protein TH63_07020 [Rufibacter radiotolerans]|uniref:DUF4440 domain-containing protein n=1 Tax=Rufibacter radiotolerans TaxID=1379910 RepID=A0A0H4VNK0_9BACT|nr:nuclear transport factor 2 family protein [Rufibacter radiotolerans]AKQ45447.1 hypothetical protein TH63_07020 [Rufibacter radiotolerans]